ncbi:MAG: toll/interleukin-1 receptor domain-containing protein [Lachnospiraceae bacterium]|nr:toll/interleukin-1 receptor domain-containing protein [Lachnospiraceae bacterium]
MGIKENHYNAFISYRHSELDSKVAIEVHRKLERFKLPANIRKNFPKDHQKIERVFRDQDELPLADNLSDPIEQALRNSDYLIVICSPRLPESKWCQREMETFKKLHGQDRILAILAEGEPEESFPDAICYKDVVSKDENGNEVISKIPVEPLAADVRADSPRKRSAMINDAVLRLAAPMFNLGYDDLKQRHREQRIKRIAIATSIATGVSVILGLIFMCLALKINSQKKVIESQHAELEKQYDIQQEKYCESMNIVSEDLLKQGLKKEAVYAIRSAMPDSDKDDSKPLLPSNIKTLTQTLNIYDLNVFVPSDIIPVDDFDTTRFDSYYGDYDFLVEYMGGQTIMCSGQYDRDHILLITDSCRFFLYDTEENVLLDYTRGLFNNPPEGYVFGAAYEDGEIFIQFNDADYVSCFEIKTPDGLETAGQIAVKDIRTSRGLNIVEDGEDIISDDGEYVMRLGIDHSLEVYKADEDEPFKILYDIRGEFYDLISTDNGNKYILRGVGSSSLLFNEEFDIIAEIPYFYECADDGMIVLYTVADDATYYDLYYVPLADYDDLIDEADKELKGFKPSEEFLGKYKMLDNKTEDSVGDIE